MSKMVEVVIDSVRVSLTNQQRIVVLREANVERYLPIWIGPYEAEAITIALQEIEVARPQTHDLIKSLLQSLNARLLRVEVVTLREDVFYGNLVIQISSGEVINVDCRPSDALALSVRAHVPILIAREVMESAGVVPEHNLESDAATASEDKTPSSGKLIDDSKERLSVFEDFLKKLEGDKPGDQPDDDKNKSEDEPDQDKDPS